MITNLHLHGLFATSIHWPDSLISAEKKMRHTLRSHALRSPFHCCDTHQGCARPTDRRVSARAWRSVQHRSNKLKVTSSLLIVVLVMAVVVNNNKQLSQKPTTTTNNQTTISVQRHYHQDPLAVQPQTSRAPSLPLSSSALPPKIPHWHKAFTPDRTPGIV